MKHEFDEKLCKDFPRLYSDRHGHVTQTCMAFGFECGNGWFDLIYKLSAQLEQLNQSLEDRYWIRASQVKEKYGTLRFYVGPVPNELASKVEKLIQQAENKSASTCEVCGGNGKSRGTAWVRTTCETCEANYGAAG